MLEKVLLNQSAENKIVIYATPDILREVANRLDKMSMTAQPNQVTIMPFTDNINVAYQKIVKLTEPMDFEKVPDDV